MPDSPSQPTPLTDQALARLRRLADGNGIAPETITLFGTEEKTYTIKGITKLTPCIEPQAKHLLGSAKNTYAKALPSFAALKTEVDKATEDFRTRTDWIPVALDQLNAQPAAGWGLNETKIPLADFSMAFTATEQCPNCGGQKMIPCQQCGAQGGVTCSYCQGNRARVCSSCGGSGFVPGQQNQPCPTCSSYGLWVGGLRGVPCNSCSGTGQMPCPACQGRRGLTCQACKGIGSMTQEVTLVCGVETHFSIVSDGLPSGLRRGIDRIGFAKLAEGHADVSPVAPAKSEEELALAHDTNTEPKSALPEQNYQAHLPYADMRVDFGSKKSLVSVFGKRGLLLGVPAFMDDAVEPARKIVRQAAKGKADLSEALKLRLMHEALGLQLAGKLDSRELRRLYPQGLSSQAAADIMAEMRRALNRTTRLIRMVVACVTVAMSGGVFAGYFMTSVRAMIASSLPPRWDIFSDVAVLFFVLTLGWISLSLSTKLVLQNNFRDTPITAWQKIGQTGYTMMTAVVVLFVFILIVMKPWWVLALIHMAGR